MNQDILPQKHPELDANASRRRSYPKQPHLPKFNPPYPNTPRNLYIESRIALPFRFLSLLQNMLAKH
jgi:hypothetical protein